ARMYDWQTTAITGHCDCRRGNQAGGTFKVERARVDERGRVLAPPAPAREHHALGKAPRLECIRKRAHHRTLADQIIKGRGPILAREHAVGRIACRLTTRNEISRGLIGAVAHNATRSAARRYVFALRMRERWEADERPEPRSLGLLPSGPDPVGEWLGHPPPPPPLSAPRNENASGGETRPTARAQVSSP